MTDYVELLPPPAPGVYQNVPMEEYALWDAVNNSSLNVLQSKSPFHYKFARYHQKPATDPQIVGNAIHTAILQPHLFDGLYRLKTQCEAVTAKGAQCSKNGTVFQGGTCLCSTHMDKDAPGDDVIPLSVNQYETTMGCRDAVFNHSDDVRTILESIPDDRRELTIVWKEPVSGLLMKGRIDGDLKAVDRFLDLKSTNDASPEAFEKKIWDYGYHRQGALYLNGMFELGEERDGEAILAVEKEPPYAVSFWEELDQDAIDAGRSQLHDLLKKLKKCTENDEWPAYDLEKWIGIPQWAYSYCDLTRVIQ